MNQPDSRVSIHAPRVGRDCRASPTRSATTGFNSRAPRGARRAAPSHGCASSLCFNSRAPRGARLTTITATSPWNVSIHAPRVGRDDPFGDGGGEAEVSIHAPRVGRDRLLLRAAGVEGVSIHAPRVGRDTVACWGRNSRRQCFNSRAPRGARHVAHVSPGVYMIVSIHAPRVGRDSASPFARAVTSGFNSRAPRGARPRGARCVRP